MTKPTSIVFSGLPGAGKTTLARAVAKDCSAAYLRIDTIEQALRDAMTLPDDVGPAGYVIACALAGSRSVVADAVNALPITRDAWRKVVETTASLLAEIEVICSDAAEHRRRVETRSIDVPGLPPLTWEDVLTGDYQAWDRPHVVVDTANRTPSDHLQTCGRSCIWRHRHR